MVAQNMPDMLKENKKIIVKFDVPVDVNKCLKQIKLLV